MKVLKKLEVEADALIELVDVDGAQRILKTADIEEVARERRFNQILAENNFAHLQLFESSELQSNQLLMEYVEGSPTVGDNASPEWYRKWGAAAKGMHAVVGQGGRKILPDGSENSMEWREFVIERLEEQGSRHILNSTLPADTVDGVRKVISAWLDKHPVTEYRLIHGDLHSNNAMIRGDEVVLFDKGSDMIYGNRFYDLAVALMERYDSDQESVAAFIDGYGKEEIGENMEEIDLWMLMRCFERHPNRFETYSGEVIRMLLEKFS